MERKAQILSGVTFIAMLLAIYMVFIYAPIERKMGILQKIFYFHVSTAWIPYLAFLVVFLCSIVFLWRRDKRWDTIAFCSAEIGLVIDTLVLITGSIWAKPAWGVWWTWEPRLTTSLIMWLLYAGYLLLRRSVEEAMRRARFAAVYGIAAFISVPISFMSIRWWRTIHPVVIKPTGIELEPPMITALIVCLVAFTLFYFCLLQQRYRLKKIKDEIEDIKSELGG